MRLSDLVDGRLCASHEDIDVVLERMLDAMSIEARELATIYFGADKTETDAIELAGRIKRHNPDIEVEIINGGQAHYFFILGVE